MTDQHDGSVGERMAKLEGLATEISRQQDAAWKRVDEHERNLSDMRIKHVEAVAKIEADIAHLERESLKESFTLKGQIAEIGWRVGVVVGAALLVLNFVLSKIDMSDFLPGNSNVKTQGRR